MGWEIRQDRRYLYRNRRVNGQPVKESLAADRFDTALSLTTRVDRYAQIVVRSRQARLHHRDRARDPRR